MDQTILKNPPEHPVVTKLRRKSICIGFDLPGFHQYPDAPMEVGFLANRHRHLFHFKLYFIVEHSNRDLEFFMMRTRILNELMARWYGNLHAIDFGANSCEAIADDLMDRWQPDGCYRVEVWEDKENGSIVEIERS